MSNISNATLGNVRDQASSAAKAAKETISGVASDVAESFKESVNDSKTSGADAIARLARSTKEAADGIEKDAPQIAGVVRDAAGRVEQISTDISNMTFTEMLDSMSDFARRKPLVFVGCGLLAGLVAARLLRSPN